jgi:alkylation response protein AidB-like acyl-CoA dehydrogenase
MAIYQAPLREMRFILYELLHIERAFAELPGHEEIAPDLLDAILEEAAKLCEAVIFPTNRTGDMEGCHLTDDEVRTPAGFKEAYRTLTASGWPSLSCDPEYGGQGLPETIHLLVEEMISSANVAFSLYPGLTYGAYITLHRHASAAIKTLFLPKLVAGEWSASMCLTEAQSGSDLGLLRTRATLCADGTYRLTGTKIFITAGEHDLTENIIHLVLARLPDAPPGIRGISMFLVPKVLVNEDGSLGERNSVMCGAIEHKMGIKGSATCVLNFDHATGYLIGEPHDGLHTMFTMMNHERLAIGLQGLALSEVAYQSAVDYAHERLQGRSPRGPQYPGEPADPIIVHPDIRRMLLIVRAHNEAARALAAWVATQIDIAHRHPNEHTREQAEDLVALLTPVIKAFFTDYGLDACNLCLQVFGGHGYISEWGMEQLVRDARIAQIYEGTNGIQALDLVKRKLLIHQGRLVERFFAVIDNFLADNESNRDLKSLLPPFEQALARLKNTTDWIAHERGHDPDVVGASASEYLHLLALVALGFMWLKMVAVALPNVSGDEGAFYLAKVATARFYMKRILPQTGSLEEAILTGAEPVMTIDAAAF